MAGFLNVTKADGTASTVTSLVSTVAIAATKGNTIIGIVKVSSGVTVTSVTDTQGNTWTIDGHSTASGPTVYVVRARLTKSLSTSDTITANFGSCNNITVIYCEYEGDYTPVDLTYSNNSGTSATSQTLTASGATTMAPQLIIAALGTGGAPSQTTISLSSGTPSNMTKRSQGPSSKNFAAMADCLATITVTPVAAWTWTSSVSWGGVIFSYKLVKSVKSNFFGFSL